MGWGDLLVFGVSLLVGVFGWSMIVNHLLYILISVKHYIKMLSAVGSVDTERATCAANKSALASGIALVAAVVVLLLFNKTLIYVGSIVGTLVGIVMFRRVYKRGETSYDVFWHNYHDYVSLYPNQYPKK